MLILHKEKSCQMVQKSSIWKPFILCYSLYDQKIMMIMISINKTSPDKISSTLMEFKCALSNFVWGPFSLFLPVRSSLFIHALITFYLPGKKRSNGVQGYLSLKKGWRLCLHSGYVSWETNSSHFAWHFLSFCSAVSCPGKPLSAGHTGVVGHPNSRSLEIHTWGQCN